jgi:hypothetical protein
VGDNNLTDQDNTEFEAHFFGGPVWDDPDEVEAEATGPEQDDGEDDVEGHASGFG